jgi:hypothetical protein
LCLMADLDDWGEDGEEGGDGADEQAGDATAGRDPVPAASRRGRGRGRGCARGAAKAKAMASKKPAEERKCFAAGCANMKAANGKFCKARHHRPYESMRYQAQKAGEMVAFEQALRPRTK